MLKSMRYRYATRELAMAHLARLSDPEGWRLIEDPTGGRTTWLVVPPDGLVLPWEIVRS
jgi:hypothetical protein